MSGMDGSKENISDGGKSFPMPLSQADADEIGGFVFASTPERPVDFLIVLGAPHLELMARAAKAYHDEFARTVIASGKWSSKHGRVLVEKLPKECRAAFETESEMVSRILQQMGVPTDAIVEEKLSTNVRENIEMSLEIVRQASGNGARTDGTFDASVGICCQSFCARRALMTYRSVSGGQECTLFPADCQSISKETWAESPYGRKHVLGEVARCGEYFA